MGTLALLLFVIVPAMLLGGVATVFLMWGKSATEHEIRAALPATTAALLLLMLGLTTHGCGW